MKLTKRLKTALGNEPVATSRLRNTPEASAKPERLSAKSAQIALEFVKPDAKSVQVAGSFNDWKPERTPLVQATKGHWVGDLRLTPGRHEYLFVVDGQWIPDPNAKESVQNPFGGYNSVLSVAS